MISITKLGVGLIALILVVGFGLVSYGQYKQTQVISNLTHPVIVKTVVVTPTVEPTATPSAAVKFYTPLKPVAK